MHTFQSGFQRNYYGKGDVTVYRLHRDSPVFAARVLMLIYGDAFWPTYTTGDNTGLIATDSMKNFIQRETLNFEGCDLESFCRFLAQRFLDKYPQAEGAQLSAEEIPYRDAGAAVAFAPSGSEHAIARVELRRSGGAPALVEAVSGLHGFKLLRLGGSAFHGFVRDEYTTLPDIHNRPLHMWLDLDWLYKDGEAAFNQGEITARVRRMVYDVFQAFESGSIQQVIYQLGSRMLAEMPEVAEVRLEAQNRTWDAVAERGDALGVYTDPRPPFGCLGLTLRR